MRLWKVKVRYYKDDMGWQDAEVLIEADYTDTAMAAGYDAIMGGAFFGRDPKRCQPVEAATITLPYPL